MVKPSDIEQWLSIDLGHLAPATRAKCLQLLGSVLDLARRDRAITLNPAADVKPPRIVRVREPRALSDAEAAELIDGAEVIDERTAAQWCGRCCGLASGSVKQPR